jgi:hypothetical protein
MAKGRVILVLLLVAAGVGLLLLGLFHNSVIVSSPAANPPEVSGLEGEPSVTFVAAQSEALSEPALTVEVARGGVARDEDGQIKKTYTGEAPKACPT